VTRQFALFS